MLLQGLDEVIPLNLVERTNTLSVDLEALVAPIFDE
jgi:hypothetical protein